MKYLTKVIETYRLSSEAEVESFLQELKSDSAFTIVKYSSSKREKKEKGEIVDEWIHFEVTKVFNDEKEPTDEIAVKYERGGIF